MLQIILLMMGVLAAGCAGTKQGGRAGAHQHNSVHPAEHTQALKTTDQSAQQPRPKAAVCEVQSGTGQDNPTEWTGPCTRTVEQPSARSFSIAGMNDGPITPGILIISVGIIKPGQAEVRGLTTHGITSRWGAAVQDVKDPFCWIGADFRICVRPAP